MGGRAWIGVRGGLDVQAPFGGAKTYGKCVGGYRVVILAGGAGRRLGGAAKPTLPVAGRSMLARVLEAVGDALERVVVGPASLGGLVPSGVRVVQEEPPGGGPVAALAAGLAELAAPAGRPDGRTAEQIKEPGASAATEPVVVLAADLPLLTRDAVGVLLAALGEHDGAVFVDDDGRLQWLCGAWSGAALRERVAGLAGPLAGRAMKEFFAPFRMVGVQIGGGGAPVKEGGAPVEGGRAPVNGEGVPVDGGGLQPWYDCDTPAGLAEAERRLAT